MTTFNCVLLVLFATFTSIHGIQQLCHNIVCFDTGSTQIILTFEDDEIFYVDFNNKSVVWETRMPSNIRLAYPYSVGENFKHECKFQLETWEHYTSVVKTTSAPEVLIYPRDDVIDQVDNTLICLVRHFFPPIIKIKWTKNREVVASDDPFEKMIPGSDGTFQVFSRQSFVPKDGDIYTCTVEHETLKEPMVKLFEFHSSGTFMIGMTAYCAICVVLGLIGFSAGIFLFCKDNQHKTR